jgi:hypothetical protein
MHWHPVWSTCWSPSVLQDWSPLWLSPNQDSCWRYTQDGLHDEICSPWISCHEIWIDECVGTLHVTFQLSFHARVGPNYCRVHWWHSGIFKEYGTTRRAPPNCTSMATRAPAVVQVRQVQVLYLGSTIPMSRGFTGRNRGGPQQGERGLRMEVANICVRGTKFPWVGGLLSKVHSELLQDHEASYWVIIEGKQVCLEWCLWWSFQASEEVVDHLTCSSSAWHHQAIWCLLWRFWHWSRRCFNARRLSDIILLKATKTRWRALPYSWSWVSGSGDGIKDVASLSTWECGSYLYGPQKLDVHLHPTRPIHEASKMAWVDQRLQVRSWLSPRKGKRHCGRVELQGSLQLLAGCMIGWRRV